jgi:HlyD family secretion protein
VCSSDLAYPDEMFTGTVRQVRLQPTTIQNVVNYTAVVDATNDRGLLLPGMTATVDFLVDSKKDVLLVPNAALTFKPTDEMLAKFKERMQKRMAGGGAQGGAPGASMGQTAEGGAHAGDMASRGEGRMGTRGSGDSSRMRRGGMGSQGGARGYGGMGGYGGTGGSSGFGDQGGSPRAGSTGMPSRIFYLDRKGAVEIAFVTTGTSDGRNTEIRGDSALAEGTKVIVAVNRAGKNDNSGQSRFSLNPRPQFPGGGPRGGRF